MGRRQVGAQQIGHQKPTDADQDQYYAQNLADRLCHFLSRPRHENQKARVIAAGANVAVQWKGVFRVGGCNPKSQNNDNLSGLNMLIDVLTFTEPEYNALHN
jgi:hypothetical protein